MKINFLGDSITAGAGLVHQKDRYSALVAAHFGAEECNYGVGGTRIARQVKRTDNPDDDVFFCRAVKMEKDAAFTFVFGGTNDYGHGDAKIGEPSDNDTYTFYGALNELIAYLVGTFPKNSLCFILPLPRFGQENPCGEGGGKEVPAAPLSGYVEAEKRVLERYGVEYLDFSGEFSIPQAPAPNEWSIDGLHPNGLGHKKLADLLIKYLEKKLG